MSLTIASQAATAKLDMIDAWLDSSFGQYKASLCRGAAGTRALQRAW
jgi:hypothetical protein